MFNLMKYEFKKNIPALVTLLVISSVLEGYYIVGFITNKVDHMGIVASFLAMVSFVSFFVIFILGIINYENDINTRSGYLVFMTPNSSLKIITSKLLYVVLLALLTFVIIGGVAFLDLFLLAIKFNEIYSFMDLIKLLFEFVDIDIAQVTKSIIFGLIVLISAIISIVSMAYLAITLSATFLQNNRYKKIISFVFFIIISIIVNVIGNEIMHINLNNIYFNSYSTFSDILLKTFPSVMYHLVVMVLCIFGCSKLIDKAINI